MVASSRRRRRQAAAGLPVLSSALAPHEDQYVVLASWVNEVATTADSLLDIGAGDGDDHYSSLIRPLVARFVGVDPDGRSRQNSALDEWHPMTIEAFARQRDDGAPTATAGPSALFDVALAIYVAEHIDDPVAFLRAARSCLRPGGSLFLITPNLWHYFGAAAKTAMALRIDDRLLEALRRRQGGEHGGHLHGAGEAPGTVGTAAHGRTGNSPPTQPAAHFPMSYKMNTVRTLRRAGAAAGFSCLQVRHLENAAVFETYFPGRLVAIPRAYGRLVHRLRLEAAFGTLICRLVN